MMEKLQNLSQVRASDCSPKMNQSGTDSWKFMEIREKGIGNTFYMSILMLVGIFFT